MFLSENIKSKTLLFSVAWQSASVSLLRGISNRSKINMVCNNNTKSVCVSTSEVDLKFEFKESDKNSRDNKYLAHSFKSQLQKK